MAWVYILRNKNGQYYVGSTIDLKKRLAHHALGHTKTTHRLVPEEVVLKQEYKTLLEARSVERKIKNLKRRDYIEKMIKDGYIKVVP